MIKTGFFLKWSRTKGMTFSLMALCSIFATSPVNADQISATDSTVRDFNYQISRDFTLDVHDNLGSSTIYGRFAISEDVEDLSASLKMKVTRTDSKGKDLWTVRDFVNDCEAPATPELLLTTPVHSTDLDGNGLDEIWMMYRLTCRTEAFPRDIKIIMYEGKTKYAVRGKTDVHLVPGMCESSGDCGHFKLDSNMRNAKPAIKKYAMKLWTDHVVEFKKDFQ